jgi:phage gpG-like protein
MIEFTYTINSQPVEKALENFQASLADQTTALREIADDFREMVAGQFASEGQAEGTPWAPRKAVGAIHESPLLVRSGALRRSLTTRDAAGHVEQLEEQSLAIGTSLPYALFHQTGTRRMPARPIIVLSGARSERWVEIVRGGIEEKTVLLGKEKLS